MTTMASEETCLPQGDRETCSIPPVSLYNNTTTITPTSPPSTTTTITTPATTITQEATDGDSIMLLEPRPFRPFKTSEEYLYAMKEDLADWLNNLYNLDINVDNFFERLDTGEVLCAHANNVRRLAEERRTQDSQQGQQQQQGQGGRRFSTRWEIPQYDVVYRQNIAPGSFFARDNVHNFIAWCRDLGIYEVLLFETDDLVLRKNEKHVILSLLEVARRGARFGMAAPLLVQMEADIDREMEQERLAEERLAESGGKLEDEEEAWGSGTRDLSTPEPPKMFYGPQAQVITNDLKSLDEMVRDLVERCSCPSQFPMVKVSEGKYRIGDTRVLIFVRILRNHVMVRVGGGWDTLEHYLDKHDPCRCRQGHRTVAGSRVGFKTSSSGLERQLMSVTYERKRSAGGKVVLIQSSTDRLTMQQAMERGGKPSSPPPHERGRMSPRSKRQDHTAAPAHIPPVSMEEVIFTQELPQFSSSPEKTYLLKNQGIMALKEKLDKDESVFLKQHPPQPVTETENLSENHEQDIPFKAVLRHSRETPCISSPQMEAKAALPRGSPKLHHNTQRIKTSLNRSRSSSLPVISPASYSAARERKATQLDAQANKEFSSVKRVEVPSESNAFNITKKHDSYSKERETAGSISRSPLSHSRTNVNMLSETFVGKTRKKSEGSSGKAECLPEQPRPLSRIPVSTSDVRSKTHASRIPKMVQNKSNVVIPLCTTEGESKLSNKITCIQQKNSTAQNVMETEKSQNQPDKEALQFFNKREKICIKSDIAVAKNVLGRKCNTEKALSDESLKHASSALNEEESCECEERRGIFLHNFGKLTQYSPKRYRDIFSDITLKSNVDYYHSQKTESIGDDKSFEEDTGAEVYHDLASMKNTGVSLQNGTCLSRKIFESHNLTESSTLSSTNSMSHGSIHSGERIENIIQEPMQTDFVSRIVEEENNHECLLSDTLQDNKSKDIEANVLETSRQ